MRNYSRVLSNPEKTIHENDTEVSEKLVMAADGNVADCQVTYLPSAGQKTKLISEFESANIRTMADVWRWSVEKYREKKLLGTRDVLAEEDEVQPNGKMFKKLELGDYR